MNWEEQWKSNQSQFGADSATARSVTHTSPMSKVNIPLLTAGIVGLVVSASIASSVLSSEASLKKAKKAHHKYLAKRAGFYVKS